MKKKLRWKKDPKPTGLASVCAGPRSSKLWDGEKEYAIVSALGGVLRGSVKSWYWYSPSNATGVHMNTCNNPCETEEEAKVQAMEWVKKRLSEAKP